METAHSTKTLSVILTQGPRFGIVRLNAQGTWGFLEGRELQDESSEEAALRLVRDRLGLQGLRPLGAIPKQDKPPGTCVIIAVDGNERPTQRGLQLNWFRHSQLLQLAKSDRLEPNLAELAEAAATFLHTEKP